jgi:predicted aspartyl protease
MLNVRVVEHGFMRVDAARAAGRGVAWEGASSSKPSRSKSCSRPHSQRARPSTLSRGLLTSRMPLVVGISCPARASSNCLSGTSASFCQRCDCPSEMPRSASVETPFAEEGVFAGLPPFAFSISFSSRGEALRIFGPTILVEVGFEASMYDQGANPAAVALSLASGGAHSGILMTVPALIDTGAVESCIDEDLANELGLPLVDRQTCSGVGGEHELNIYLGHIRIPSLGQINWGRFTGARLASGRQPHRALIGRTQLAGMILIYDGRTGAVTLTS